MFLISPLPLWQNRVPLSRRCYFLLRQKDARGSEKTFLIFIFITQNLLLRQREKGSLCMNAFFRRVHAETIIKSRKNQREHFCIERRQLWQKREREKPLISPSRGLSVLSGSHLRRERSLGKRRSSNYKSKIMTASSAGEFCANKCAAICGPFCRRC